MHANGVVASLAVTEFMLSVAGIREPNRLLTYHGRTGKVTVSINEPQVEKARVAYVGGGRADGRQLPYRGLKTQVAHVYARNIPIPTEAQRITLMPR